MLAAATNLTDGLPSIFKEPKRYRQMRNDQDNSGKGYLDQLKERIDKEKYFAIYSTSDGLVPGRGGSLYLAPDHEREHHLLGHFGPMVSPSVWHQIQDWVKESGQ